MKELIEIQPEEQKGGNKKLAAYMGLLPIPKFTNHYWNELRVVVKCDFINDIGKLFEVVDKICEVTGWKYELIKGGYHALCFIDGESTIILKANKVREQAIYSACLAAIDHLEKQTL